MYPSAFTSLEQNLQPFKTKLATHPLYDQLNSIAAIQNFMEAHVFAVWDFMSLVKALQMQLTCTRVPWLPAPDAAVARFINEIVLAEESDIDAEGNPCSHFEMYLAAMQQIGANTQPIEQFLVQVRKGIPPKVAASNLTLPDFVQQFVAYTFEVIEKGQAHEIAAAFTFGREDLIPDMFLEVVNRSGEKGQENQYHRLTYYLNRHIELDGDEHGPLAHKMVSMLCGDDAQKWASAEKVSQKALEVRIALWDGINATLSAKKATLMG